jgi:tRNA-2-methylthio-N6-dimethylallyladenosine synthase
VKHDRFNRLVEAVNACSRKRNLSYMGRTVEVLVEGFSKNNENTVSGRTRSGKLVNLSGGTELIGELVNVKIIKANSFSLVGEEIK